VLIACAFNYEAHATEFSKLGRIPVLKARMNADLHMAGDLKNTGKGNLFVIFGEPDITLLPEKDGKVRVRVNGVDVFHPQTGEVRSEQRRRHRLLVHRYRLQRRKLLRSPCLLLGANDPTAHSKPRSKPSQRGSLGYTQQRYLARLPQTKIWTNCGKGDQPPRDEVMKVFKI